MGSPGGDAPHGAPVLFLHGWGVGPGAYGAAVHGLGALGCEVWAPALPGFGGTPALEGADCTLEGYARWAAAFLAARTPDAPTTVVGHSFGAGVALQLAHDFPGTVRTLVLCNAIGGVPVDDGARPARDRPVWAWGRDIGTDLLTLPAAARIVPPVVLGALPNFVQHPRSMWRTAHLARHADLGGQAAVVAAHGVPLTMVWSDRDRLVSHASFDALCRAARVRGTVVPGPHAWLIADPTLFADLVLRAMVEADPVVHVARRVRPLPAATTRPAPAAV